MFVNEFNLFLKNELKFVDWACEISKTLVKKGAQFVDFIEPSSGLPVSYNLQ